ncbi:copper chaperone PCu(A)C [Rivibacter subsaxonicus]|uniref:copper chaperone PCu(A)C n=1 Tax=Rivibacter subsaxonicus TaxID=457575 RepID=UPI001F5F5589|nr:copper chaperone PCu(A)C [Rivibacter subsaxonicus]
MTVSDPWVRATVAQQPATGAFMQLLSVQGARVLEARSPAAAMVEIHEMKMDGGVMQMRPVQALELPAGKTVELKPGGYHVMLMGLKQQLKEGDSVPLSLVVETAGGKRETIELKAPVRALGAVKH